MRTTVSSSILAKAKDVWAELMAGLLPAKVKYIDFEQLDDLPCLS